VTKLVTRREGAMARIIKMPSQDELPEGPRREFVVELRRYYRAAGRPPLRHVSRLIEGRQDLKEVTASQETIRRILRGIVIPVDWNRVNAVFQVFCEIGEIDPDADRWEDSHYGGSSEENNRENVRRLWDAALEEEPNPSPIPRPTPPRPDPALAASRFAGDPWARENSPGPGSSDEPPF
jgi:hypothetical protein